MTKMRPSNELWRFTCNVNTAAGYYYYPWVPLHSRQSRNWFNFLFFFFVQWWTCYIVVVCTLEITMTRCHHFSVYIYISHNDQGCVLHYPKWRVVLDKQQIDRTIAWTMKENLLINIQFNLNTGMESMYSNAKENMNISILYYYILRTYVYVHSRSTWHELRMTDERVVRQQLELHILYTRYCCHILHDCIWMYDCYIITHYYIL